MYLWSVDCGIVDLGHTTGIEGVPHSADPRTRCADRELGAVCPPRLNAWTAWRAPAVMPE